MKKQLNESRFEKELSGELGDFWKRDALKKLDDYTRQADEKAIVEPDGAIRWKSNGHYLMDDFCEVLEYAGYDFSREATAIKRDQQNAEFIAEYRKQKHELTDEEKAEMRAAFGPGEKIVDVLTGEVYYT